MPRKAKEQIAIAAPTRTSIAFSGGRTSALMLRLYLDANGGKLKDGDVVLFCNTGKERDETLDFVHECETRWGVPVVWLEYTHSTVRELDEKYRRIGGFSEEKWNRTKHRVRKFYESKCNFALMPYHDWKRVDYATAHRNGQPDCPFDKLLRWSPVLPNVRGRVCTAELKVRTMDRYLCSIGMHKRNDLIGIRDDERHRTIEILAGAPKRVRPQFPLIDAGICVRHVNSYWVHNSFDLQLLDDEGNCDLCFLKSTKKLYRLIGDRPHAAEWWAEKEQEKSHAGDGGRFRLDRPSYTAILAQMNEPRMPGWGDTDDAGGADDDIPCSCSEGGYRYLDSEDE